MAALALLSITGPSYGQPLTNTLSLERRTNGLRLHYALRDTNGVFFLLQSGDVQTLANGGQILKTGAASQPSGVLDLPFPPKASATFFGLVHDRTGPLKTAPFAAPPRLAWIPPGTFTMGSPATEKDRYEDEGPQLSVTLTKGFFMGKYEVTQAEYLVIMGKNPSFFSKTNGYPEDLNRPVDQVSWEDATNYCAKLTVRDRATGVFPAGWAYRLPTEAEWEYACRAGTTTPFHYGAELRAGFANFDGHYEYTAVGTVTNRLATFLGQPRAVGSYTPNAWGLYDMHGNMYEWCWDWAADYASGSVLDPKGPPLGSFRVFRGGAWEYPARLCRSAVRNYSWPGINSADVGFRIVLAPASP
jgi:formylglycine-generating enzyme required for sulfatase activity